MRAKAVRKRMSDPWYSTSRDRGQNFSDDKWPLFLCSVLDVGYGDVERDKNLEMKWSGDFCG